MAPSPNGKLVAERARGRGREDAVFYGAKWRASRDGRQMKRRLGPAWLAVGADGATHARRGRIQPEFLDERRAYARTAEVIAQCEDEDARREEIDAARKRAGWTFGALADKWLEHAERVRRLKPSTMRDLRSILARPGDAKRRGGTVKARLMTMLEDVPAASIVVDDIEDYFRLLADDGVSPRDGQPPPRGPARDLQLRLPALLGVRARAQPRRPDRSAPPGRPSAARDLLRRAGRAPRPLGHRRVVARGARLDASSRDGCADAP